MVRKLLFNCHYQTNLVVDFVTVFMHRKYLNCAEHENNVSILVRSLWAICVTVSAL